MHNGENSEIRESINESGRVLPRTSTETENMGDSTGRSERDGTTCPIEKHGQLLKHEQREFIRDLAEKSFAQAQKSDGQYIQDVVLTGSDDAAREFATYLQSLFRESGRGFYAVSCHDSHVHVLHDCSYSDGSCRCLWKKKARNQEGVEFRRRLLRLRRRGIRELTLSDWKLIYLYFTTEGRSLKAPYINRKIQTIPDSSKDLSKSRLERPRRKSSELAGKEEQDLEGNTDELRCLFENGESGPRFRGCRSEPHVRAKRKREENQEVFCQLQSLLQQFPVAPLINIVDHPVYLESPIARYRASSCKIQDAIDVFSKKLMRYSIEDFHKEIYSKEGCIPIFSAGHVKLEDYYYNDEDSLSIINKLIEFQFNNDEEYIFKFLKSLYDVLNRNIPKCNCMLIHSPPSAGKNFFFDMVTDYFLSRGQLGRANKHNNFAFQDAYGKRIIMWNEPNYETAMTDQLKMMTAGDAYTVTVKNKPDAAVYKTPMIILTNNYIPLMNDVSFKDRIIQFTWKPAPFLKECNKKPYPITLYNLFLQHGIIKQ